jgi:hypothetical protein
MTIIKKGTCFVFLLQVLLNLSSCSMLGRLFSGTERERNEILEYIISDTSICYLPELMVADDLFLSYLDSIISLYLNCQHCVFNIPYPNYFTISGKGTANDFSLVITNSTYTEEIKTNKNEFIGCFYYADNLFIVHDSIGNLKDALFQKTECSTAINKCNLVILGICFKATMTFSNGKYKIIYDCEDVFINK